MTFQERMQQIRNKQGDLDSLLSDIWWSVLGNVQEISRAFYEEVALALDAPFDERQTPNVIGQNHESIRNYKDASAVYSVGYVYRIPEQDAECITEITCDLGRSTQDLFLLVDLPHKYVKVLHESVPEVRDINYVPLMPGLVQTAFSPKEAS